MSTIYLKNCTVFYYKRILFFAGKIGVSKIKLPIALTNISFYITKSYIKILTTRSDKIYLKLVESISNEIDKTIAKNNSGFTNKIMLFGIGFRSWSCKINNMFKFVVLKIGFSKDICVKIPSNIKMIVLKPTLILFKSLDKDTLNQFVAFLRSIKIPDSYKGKGLRYIKEITTLKAGKK